MAVDGAQSTYDPRVIKKIVGGRADKPDAKKVWANPELTCYFSTPIPVGQKHVYVVTGMIASSYVLDGASIAR